MKNILLIEDNEDLRENTAEILELANYKVTTAENGKVGVEMALESEPDLIICDIMMPELDGYGVLHAIHRNEKIKNTPFIFLTAKSERSDLRKGMELGADDYITKPFTSTELLNAVSGRLTKLEQLKSDLTPGIDGLNYLMKVYTGKNILEAFTEGRNINKYKKKQLVYTEGNHPNRLYYILKGKIKVFKANEDGKELVTNIYGPGEFFGYVALLEGDRYKDSAEALEETQLAIIPKEDFEELINTNNEAAGKFIRLLAKNVSDKEQHLLGLAYHSLRKKVAEALMSVKGKYEQAEEKNTVIDMSRENLAMVAATATESLIRTLGDFRNEGLIRISEKGITILRPDKLAHIIQ